MAEYQFHYAKSVELKVRSETAFEYLDDPKRMSSHMGKSSMMMAGSKMEMKVDAKRGKEIGSVISMSGHVLGLNLSLQESVTERNPPFLKTWETFGPQNLIILDQYKMGFKIEKVSEFRSKLTVSIDYSHPGSAFKKVLGKLLSGVYAKWCVDKMIKDAAVYFETSGT